MSVSLDSASLSTLIYDNCTLAARWAAVAWHSEDMGLSLTISMVRKGLSGYFKAHNITDASDGELICWVMTWADDTHPARVDIRDGESHKGFQHIANGSNVIANSMWNYGHDECMDTACPLMGWQGVPDLAGQGVSAVSANRFQKTDGWRRCW